MVLVVEARGGSPARRLQAQLIENHSRHLVDIPRLEQGEADTDEQGRNRADEHRQEEEAHLTERQRLHLRRDLEVPSAANARVEYRHRHPRSRRQPVEKEHRESGTGRGMPLNYAEIAAPPRALRGNRHAQGQVCMPIAKGTARQQRTVPYHEAPSNFTAARLLQKLRCANNTVRAPKT